MQVSKLDFPTGLGLYEGLPDPKIRLEIVKPPSTLSIFSSWNREKKGIIYGLKSLMEIVDLLS